jgi:hypothetical protein
MPYKETTVGTRFPRIVADMSDPLSPTVRARRAARQIEQATRRRDGAMAEMRDQGKTLREIAEVTGLTHTGVRKILRRQQENE